MEMYCRRHSYIYTSEPYLNVYYKPQSMPPIESLALIGKRHGPAVRFQLVIPDDGEICPITQEPIATSTLDFLDCPFDPNYPDFTAIRLPCSHTFSALCLVFHWARNDTVRCPLCRSGTSGACLNLRKLPPHFRLRMGRRVRESKRRDRAETIRENESVARQIQQTASVICIVRTRHGTEFHAAMTGIPILDQIIFTAVGSDIRTFLLSTTEAVLTVAIDYGMHTMRFPSSDWFSVPTEHASFSARLNPLNYYISITPYGVRIQCNIPASLFNIVAAHMGIALL